MEATIAWLNANAGVLTLLFSFVVTGATVFYVVLTRQLVFETKKLRQAQAQPHVSIRVQSSPAAFGFADLVVENLGLGPAYSVKFDIQRDIEIDARDRRMSDVGFLKYGLSYLAPGQSLSTYILRLIGMDNEKLAGSEKISFTIGVSYKDAFGNTFSEGFEIDFAQFVNLHRLGTPPLSEIAKELKKLQDNVHKLATGFSKLKVIAYTTDEIRREHEEFRRRIVSQAGSGSEEPWDTDTQESDEAT